MSHRRNIELKARCADLEAARDAAIRAGAVPTAVLVQTDTYFHSRNGRLKLREIHEDHAELIWYFRDNSTELRNSDYVVTPIIDVPTALAALSSALGIRGKVHKRRELLMFHNVRIHLDEVEGLGTFVEFEAVIENPADEEISLKRLRLLTEAMHIKDDDRIAVSYSDVAGI